MLRRRHGWISALWGLRIAVEWGVFPHFVLCFVLLFCWCCCYCWWCRLSSSPSSSLSYKVNKNFISQSIFPLSFCSRFWCHFRLSNNTPHFDNIKVEYKRNSLDFFFFFFCCRPLPRRHIPAAVSISPIRNNWPTKTFSGKESEVDGACECYTVAPISSVPYRGSKKKRWFPESSYERRKMTPQQKISSITHILFEAFFHHLLLSLPPFCQPNRTEPSHSLVVRQSSLMFLFSDDDVPSPPPKSRPLSMGRMKLKIIYELNFFTFTYSQPTLLLYFNVRINEFVEQRTLSYETLTKM